MMMSCTCRNCVSHFIVIYTVHVHVRVYMFVFTQGCSHYIQCITLVGCSLRDDCPTTIPDDVCSIGTIRCQCGAGQTSVGRMCVTGVLGHCTCSGSVQYMYMYMHTHVCIFYVMCVFVCVIHILYVYMLYILTVVGLLCLVWLKKQYGLIS